MGTDGDQFYDDNNGICTDLCIAAKDDGLQAGPTLMMVKCERYG